VNAGELRHQMRVRGLTGAEVARRAKAHGHRVAEATISHALNGWRIHPAKLRAIAAVLQQVDPLPGVDGLVQADPPGEPDREGARPRAAVRGGEGRGAGAGMAPDAGRRSPE
jgi:hypothetical protein